MWYSFSTFPAVSCINSCIYRSNSQRKPKEINTAEGREIKNNKVKIQTDNAEMGKSQLSVINSWSLLYWAEIKRGHFAYFIVVLRLFEEFGLCLFYTHTYAFTHI